MTDLVEQARSFALAARGRLLRPGERQARPLDEHLQAVAEACARRTDEPLTLALAWVGDVVENSAVTFGDLERALGAELTGLVAEITPVSLPSDGSRAERVALDAAHFRRASARAKTVKLVELGEECRALAKPNAALTATFVAERRVLLEALAGGDERALAKASELLERCSARLPTAKTEAVATPARANERGRLEDLGLEGAFLRAFSAKDLAEPLDAASVVPALPERRDHAVEHAAGFSDVIVALTRHDQCFVRMPDGTRRVITRGDLQKPVARMWLFGIITLAEMDFARRIRTLWPAESFGDRISPGRLEKARALLAERARRGEHADLVECLQLADKAQLLMTNPDELGSFGFASASAAKRAARELEALRNHLAHAQDIVTHDWPQITRLAWRAAAERSARACEK